MIIQKTNKNTPLPNQNHLTDKPGDFLVRNPPSLPAQTDWFCSTEEGSRTTKDLPASRDDAKCSGWGKEKPTVLPSWKIPHGQLVLLLEATG